MPKGRHRKAQLTVLPAGSRVQTGKARSAAKNAAYNLPLPVQLSPGADDKNVVTGRQRWHGNGKCSNNSSSWTHFLCSLIGWGQDASSQSQRKSRPDLVRGRYEPMTRAVFVEVTCPTAGSQVQESDQGDRIPSASMQLLWQCGFFGKGTLSRSEPTWHARQLQARRVQQQRARGNRVYTPEELTALRRKERRAAKIERARLAVRAGQQLADGIVALGGELTEEDERTIAREVQQDLAAQANRDDEADVEKDESAYGKHIPGLIYLKPEDDEQPSNDLEEQSSIVALEEEDDFIDVEDMEILQLSSQETLFLAGMLGILEVVDERDQPLSLEHLYALLLSSCLPPAQLKPSPLSTPAMDVLQSSVHLWARPDNPFLLQYVAYHHFRSLGWVVRSGIKFCVDWLLYKRGPAFSHAEFAIVVLPVYEDPKDEQSSPFTPYPMGGARDWVWFSSVNRVNTQVLKTLILCYVVIPPFRRISASMLATPQGFVEGLQSGESYRVREYSVRRFTPQRMRA